MKDVLILETVTNELFNLIPLRVKNLNCLDPTKRNLSNRKGNSNLDSEPNKLLLITLIWRLMHSVFVHFNMPIINTYILTLITSIFDDFVINML